MSYADIVSGARRDYWQRQSAYQPSGLEMMLGGFGQGLGAAYVGRLEDKRQREQMALAAKREEDNAAYMREQNALTRQTRERSEKQAKGTAYQNFKDIFTQSVPPDIPNEQIPSAWAQTMSPMIRAYGYDPADPVFSAAPVLTPQMRQEMADVAAKRQAQVNDLNALAAQRGRPQPVEPMWIIRGGNPYPFDKNRDQFQPGDAPMPQHQAGVGETGTWRKITDGKKVIGFYNTKTLEYQTPAWNPGGRAETGARAATPAPQGGARSLFRFNKPNPFDAPPVPSAPMVEGQGSQAPQPGTGAPPEVKIVRTATGPSGERLGMGEDGQMYFLK
jgi:hypothetical protein